MESLSINYLERMVIKSFQQKIFVGAVNYFDAIFINTWTIEMIPLIRIFKLKSDALRAQ